MKCDRCLQENKVRVVFEPTVMGMFRGKLCSKCQFDLSYSQNVAFEVLRKRADAKGLKRPLGEAVAKKLLLECEEEE